MSNFAINIDESQIKNMVAEGILAQLTDEARAAIISQAISHLLTPQQTNTYSSVKPVSPLQEAFNRASENAVREVVREMVIDNPEFNQKIREGVGDALIAACSDNYDLQAKIGESLGAVITESWRAHRD